MAHLAFKASRAVQPTAWKVRFLRRLVGHLSAQRAHPANPGFSVSPEEAIELSERRGAVTGDDENREAVACYARAMDHVGTLATDPSFRWSERVILDLHFDACYFQRDKDPGLCAPARSPSPPLTARSSSTDRTPPRCPT